MTRRELGLAGLLLFLLACIGFGVDFLRGETIAPMDLLSGAQGFSEGRPALSPGSPQEQDILDALLPSWHFARAELRKGRLPWWNPVFTGGAPSLSSLFEGFLTPRFLLYAALPEPVGYGLGLVVQAALAGLGMYLFCRRGLGRFPALVGAVTFMFCGFNAAWAQWPHAATTAMIPWMLWALAKVLAEPGPRAAGILGICVALVLHGGFPSVAAYGFYVAGSLALVAIAPGLRDRRQLGATLRATGYATLGLAIGIALTAWQLAPSLEFLHGLDLSYRHFGVEGLALEQSRWLFDPALGAKAPVEDAAYVGVLPWLLLPITIAAIFRRRPGEGGRSLSPLFWLATLVLVLSARYHCPVRLARLICELPVLRSNPPMRLTSLIGLAGAVLAALGAQVLVDWQRPLLAQLVSRKPGAAVVAPIVAAAILAAHLADVSRLVRYHNGRVPNESFLPETPLLAEARQRIVPGQSVMATWPTFQSAGTLGSYGFTEFFRHDFRRPSDQAFLDHAMKSRWSRETSANFDLARIKLDSPWLIPLNVRFVLTSTVIAYSAWSNEVVRFADPLTEVVQDFAIAPSRDVCAVAFIPTLDSSRRVGSLRVEVQRPRGQVVASSTLPLRQLRDGEWNAVRIPEVDLAGEYSLVLTTSPDTQARLGVLTSKGDTQAGDLVISGKRVDGDLALRLEHCSPSLPEHWRIARKGTGTLLLENTQTGPGAVLLDASAWDAEPSTGSFDIEHVTLTEHRAGHRAYEVTSEARSFLVASIRALEGWSATVDGAPTEVRAYRGFLVSVAVPPGPHRVELRYSPPREGRYLLVSLGALIACVLLVRRRSVAPLTR